MVRSIDYAFLESCGLGSLDSDTKDSLLRAATQSMELSVGSRLSVGLSDAELNEFESFIDRKDAVVDAWLAAHRPDFLNDSIYQQVRAGAPQQIPDNVVRAEYASLMWLKLHRPNYAEIVEEEVEILRAEFTARAGEILASHRHETAPKDRPTST